MVRFRVFSLVALVAFAVPSGCVGVLTADAPGEPPSATTETPTSTTAEPTSTGPATPTETDERYTDCNATPSIDSVDEVPSDAIVLGYAGLSTERRTELDAAVGGSNSAGSVDTVSLSERTDAYGF